MSVPPGPVPPAGDGPPGQAPSGYGPPPGNGQPGYGPPPQYGPPPGYGPAGYPPPGYGPPAGWVPVRPTSTLAVVALVCVAVAPPVGLVFAWLALGETHPVTGHKGGRELATVALWVNAAITLVGVLVLGAFVLQVLATFAAVLPVIATTP